MSFLRRQWFLAALALAVTLGALLPGPVSALGQFPGLRSTLVATALFLMGITVPARALIHAFQSPLPGLLALCLNVVVVPLLALGFAQFLPPDLAGGLIVAAAVPCTLASALAWTRRGGGNEAIPMMVMLITNTLCFLIAPLTIWLLLGTLVKLDLAQQVTRLAGLVVLPLVSAALLRLHPAVAMRADHHKHAITQIALAAVLVMVAFGAAATYQQATAATHAAASPASDAQSPPVPLSTGWLLLTALAAAAVHAIALFLGWSLAGTLGMPPENRLGVAIAGSQKTLMIGLQISLDCGVSAIPMTFYHAAQLFIDTLFVSRVGHPVQLRSRLQQGASHPAADKAPSTPTHSGPAE